MSKKITFEESLGNSDWGLIINNEGRLMGLFIPDGSTEDDVPDSIIHLCCNQFGVDPQEFYGSEYEHATLH